MKQAYKVVVTVPETAADQLREAIGKAGGGQAGDYSFCSFSSKGIGRFLPGEGAHPTIGSIGVLEQVVEERIEISCDEDQLTPVVDAIKQAHPYEEPVIDIYSILLP